MNRYTTGIQLLLFLLMSNAAAAQAPVPACESADFHALDFWIGEWEAVIPAGGPLPSGSPAPSEVLAASAKVESIVDGCAYLEHWDSQPFGNGRPAAAKASTVRVFEWRVAPIVG